ncbi:hypothetical protein VNO78_34982 [Psophocarpus tetragonolobus]|uniref:THIF-type NAD/FAD binding fold domain-containing protein n=1 Tax=Psophocarpus tetragonolobus TaxID=3891 RepID=A0AAN9RR98_PSOTE
MRKRDSVSFTANSLAKNESCLGREFVYLGNAGKPPFCYDFKFLKDPSTCSYRFLIIWSQFAMLEQFLFRDRNIGQSKSTIVASATCINPSLNIEAQQNQVGTETENVFNDTSWKNLSVMVKALDNVNARL